jgi:hypothetical protein
MMRKMLRGISSDATTMLVPGAVSFDMSKGSDRTLLGLDYHMIDLQEYRRGCMCDLSLARPWFGGTTADFPYGEE